MGMQGICRTEALWLGALVHRSSHTCEWGCPIEQSPLMLLVLARLIPVTGFCKQKHGCKATGRSAYLRDVGRKKSSSGNLHVAENAELVVTACLCREEKKRWRRSLQSVFSELKYILFLIAQSFVPRKEQKNKKHGAGCDSSSSDSPQAMCCLGSVNQHGQSCAAGLRCGRLWLPCAGSSALHPKSCHRSGHELPPVEEEKWVRAHVFRTEKQPFTLVRISCYLLVGSNRYSCYFYYQPRPQGGKVAKIGYSTKTWLNFFSTLSASSLIWDRKSLV